MFNAMKKLKALPEEQRRQFSVNFLAAIYKTVHDVSMQEPYMSVVELEMILKQVLEKENFDFDKLDSIRGLRLEVHNLA